MNEFYCTGTAEKKPSVKRFCFCHSDITTYAHFKCRNTNVNLSSWKSSASYPVRYFERQLPVFDWLMRERKRMYEEYDEGIT